MPNESENNALKKDLLTNPKGILSIARRMGANVRKAEILFEEMLDEPHLEKEWFDKLNMLVDLTVTAIIETLRSEFKRQGMGEFDVEKHFLSAMLDLKRCTPESIRRAQESIKMAKAEVMRLAEIKRDVVDKVLEI